MPTRIDRYVLKEVFFPFLGGVVFFVFVFLMFQVVRLADYFINHGVGLLLLAKITLYITAAFLPIILPISFLVAVIMGFSRLSADSEIVALKASGFSLYRLYVPVATFSLLVSCLMFYLTYFFIPWGNREFKRTVIKMGNTKVVSHLREGTFTEGFFDLLIYAEKVDSKENLLQGVFIFDERDPRNPLTIIAARGAVIPQKADSELSAAAILKLNEGSIHRSNVERFSYEKISFQEYRVALKVLESSTDDIRFAKTLSSADLKLQMREHASDLAKFREYAVEYWKRIALALAPLIFGVFGVGLGVMKTRNVRSNAILVAFITVVLYWGLHVLGINLTQRGWLPPWLAMQASNILILPFAIWSFKRSTW